jgi:hypothetical protein
MLIVERNLFNRDFRGRLSPELSVDDGKNSYYLTGYKKIFFVEKSNDGKWYIWRRDTYVVYKARYTIGIVDYFGYVVPSFDSMIQATKYMIENALILD